MRSPDVTAMSLISCPSKASPHREVRRKHTAANISQLISKTQTRKSNVHKSASHQIPKFINIDFVCSIMRGHFKIQHMLIPETIGIRLKAAVRSTMSNEWNAGSF